ncbi:glycosyltransferase family 2 protein [Acinetobacter sp. ANC 4648]|uniref:glycosyltransferase family 2 protein n=1 Tax=Acinetobacter sp. ANC 4648 TaxID=1977875 RepID=UPI000A3345D5|nr:glycosyltransferase family 2 protein [Acinetobacter sp. ANC 4648]OTG85228.1 glycosyl transferase [Acinetobacter sp. ANC 4648]
MFKYGFIIPVYNHPHYLVALLQSLAPFKLPIVMVNDGSEAQCTQILRELAAQYTDIVLVEHAQNQGKGQAVVTGLRTAEQMGLSHTLQLDCDGQHDWNDIAKFLEISQQNPNAMVIGQPIFDDTVPKGRLYGRYATHIWVWINSLSFEIKDSMCGFRVYPLKPTLAVLNSAKFQAGMGFDSEILVRLKWENISFLNVPTKVIYPEHGISHFNLWRDNWGISKVHSRLFAGMLLRLPKLIRHKIQSSTHD